jgi:pantetheine-phosphate adenylyltransferase
MEKRIAVLPGSFNPPTWGHYNMIHAAIRLYDEVHVLIATNPKKTPWIPLVDLLRILREDMEECYSDRVKITCWAGTTIQYCEEVKAKVILRSFRNSIDVEYEQSIAHINRKMNPLIQTVYLSLPPETSMISSSAVRELCSIGCLDTAMELVPGNIADYIRDHINTLNINTMQH